MDTTRPIIDIDGTAYSATPQRDLEQLIADLYASPPLAVVTGLAGDMQKSQSQASGDAPAAGAGAGAADAPAV